MSDTARSSDPLPDTGAEYVKAPAGWNPVRFLPVYNYDVRPFLRDTAYNPVQAPVRS